MWPDQAVEGVSDAAIDALVHRVRQRLAEADPQFQLRSRVFLTREPTEIPTEEPIVQTLTAVSRRVLRRHPRYIGLAGWVEMSLMTQAGIPSVLYGPVGTGAHAAVEWVDVESIVQCAWVLAETLCDFCGVADN